MRIVYVLLLDIPSTRAHATQTMRTARALACRGHRVVLQARLREDQDPWSWLRKAHGIEPVEGLDVLPLSGRRADLARGSLLWRLTAELLARPNGTVFYARERRLLVPFLRLRRIIRPSAPVVVEWHNMEHRLAEQSGDGARARRIRGEEGLIARQADAIITTTGCLAREIEETFCPEAPVKVIPSGVEVEAFLGIGLRRGILARADVRLVYAGSLRREKGVDVLIRSLLHLPAPVHLVVVGGNEPADLERLRRLVGEIGLTGRVRFTGHVNAAEVPKHLSQADLLVVPAADHMHALRYTSPLKLFEAMATGIPIVAGPSPVFLEVLEDGRNALVAEGLGPEALAAAVTRAMLRPVEARAIGRRAMQQMRNDSWEHRAERIEAFLERVLVNPEPRPGSAGRGPREGFWSPHTDPRR